VTDKQEIKIVKKIFKKVGHAHHGGAWKIAYADFVTAMMAFFMLMWLINTVTVEQKKGIADYFTQNLTKIEDGKETDKILSLKGAQVEEPSEQSLAGNMPLKKIKEKIEQKISENKVLKSMRKHINLELTPTGLNIDIIDSDALSMFVPGGIEMLGPMKDILQEISKIVNESVNKISITGHTDVIQYTNTKDYSNWELSADRANATRKMLQKNGVDEGRIYFIKGQEAKDLFDPSNPTSRKNRRITITLLK